MEEGWERPPRLELSLDQLQQLIEPAFPGASISEHEVLATGLANTNIRFRLRERQSAYVLRAHTRDAKAALRERELMNHFASQAGCSIPVAPLMYSDPAPDTTRLPGFRNIAKQGIASLPRRWFRASDHGATANQGDERDRAFAA